MNNAQEIDYRKSKRNSRIAWGFAIFFALFWLVVALVPFVFMIVNSFRKQFDMLSQGVFHFPDPWYFDNYPNIVKNGFFGYFGRSVLIVACSLVLMLAISACAAYPLSRMTFKARGLIYAGIVAMMSIPMHVTLIPIFKMTNAINKFSNFFRIILPLSKSGLSTLAIYNGVSMWNEFAFANTLLTSPSSKTLPLALGQFKGEHSADMPLMLAVLVLSALPMIILFIIFQDKLVKGMMAGAVKG